MAQLVAVLDALHSLCAEGQVMVDLFVNYDCDLQAANLFERSMKGLSKLLRRGQSSSSALFSSQQALKAREVAIEAVLAILKSLDKWAHPLKVHALSHTRRVGFCVVQHCFEGNIKAEVVYKKLQQQQCLVSLCYRHQQMRGVL